MENESLREPKNTTVVFLSLLLVAAVIWAIIASVMASKSRKESERTSAERDQIRLEADQIRTEAQRTMADAEKLRKVAYEEMRKNQLRIQEDLRKKAADAAKAAQVKVAPAKAPVSKTTKTPVKTSTTKSRR
jgi:FtsZ-interacting cell division protein ZipA